MKTKLLSVPLSVLCLAAVAYCGYKVTIPDLPGIALFNGTPLDTSDNQQPGHEYSPLEEFLRKANVFAQDVVAACGGGGETEEASSQTGGNNNTDLGDIADTLDLMVQLCQFCVEDPGSLVGGASKEMLASHDDRLPGDEILENGVPVTLNYAPYEFPDGAGPGVNIHVKNLKSILSDKDLDSCNPGDIAIAAGVIMHEAFHALNDHEGDGGEDGIDEQEASKVEIAFLCCAIDVIKGDGGLTQGEKDAAVEAICDRIYTTQIDYCTEGGTGWVVPPECDCPLNERNWGDEVVIPNGILDRLESVENRGFKPTTRSFSKLNGSLRAFHHPEFQELTLTAKKQLTLESWTFDMEDIIGPGKDSMEMESTSYRDLYFACRDQVTGHGSLIHCRVGWSGEQPTFVVNTLVESSSIGDIISMADVAEYQDSIAMYDYTNAKIWSVNILDGALTEIASPVSFPELWDFQQLYAAPFKNEEETEIIGIYYWLGVSQTSNMSDYGREEFLVAKDLGPDGTVDSVQRFGVQSQ